MPLDNRLEVIVLQHPSETRHHKNTATFLTACLARSRIVVGEDFGPDLAGWLQTLPAPWLLYPRHPALPAPAPMSESGQPGCLLIIDATWRKSLKMLYLNPALSALPRLSLDPPVTRLYRIRTAKSPAQLSTFEASCYALAQLEQNTHTYNTGLTAFAAYMQQLADFAPQAHRPAGPPAP